MPKIILSISLKDVDPILKGIERYKMRINDCPYFEGSREAKLFWEGYDAARYEDAISIKDEWSDEVDIFNGYQIIKENI